MLRERNGGCSDSDVRNGRTAGIGLLRLRDSVDVADVGHGLLNSACCIRDFSTAFRHLPFWTVHFGTHARARARTHTWS